MRFLSVNADCFLIELASLEETLALYNKLQNTQLNGIKDLVPAAKTILVFLMRSKPILKRWLLQFRVSKLILDLSAVAKK